MLSRHGFIPIRLLSRFQSRTLTSKNILDHPRRKTTEPIDYDGSPDVDLKAREFQQFVGEKEGKKAKPPLDGLHAKQARLELSLKRRTAQRNGRDAKAVALATGSELGKKSSRAQKSAKPGPELLVQGSKHHHDLESFLVFAEKNELRTTTTVYKGTLYEYTVADVLKTFGFSLHRTGRSNDLGIDLLGLWHLPDNPHEMKVLIQCKATKPTPATVRELEGAYLGAPSAWQGDNMLALLVSTQPSTKGVITAVQRSKSPIGVLQVDSIGHVRQFLWNTVAGERGLAGLGVTARYSDKDKAIGERVEIESELNETIALTWIGKPWRTGKASPIAAIEEAAQST